VGEANLINGLSLPEELPLKINTIQLTTGEGKFVADQNDPPSSGEPQDLFSSSLSSAATGLVKAEGAVVTGGYTARGLGHASTWLRLTTMGGHLLNLGSGALNFGARFLGPVGLAVTGASVATDVIQDAPNRHAYHAFQRGGENYVRTALTLMRNELGQLTVPRFTQASLRIFNADFDRTNSPHGDFKALLRSVGALEESLRSLGDEGGQALGVLHQHLGRIVHRLHNPQEPPGNAQEDIPGRTYADLRQALNLRMRERAPPSHTAAPGVY
jgi:hypothetical protein